MKKTHIFSPLNLHIFSFFPGHGIKLRHYKSFEATCELQLLSHQQYQRIVNKSSYVSGSRSLLFNSRWLVNSSNSTTENLSQHFHEKTWLIDSDNYVSHYFQENVAVLIYHRNTHTKRNRMQLRTQHKNHNLIVIVLSRQRTMLEETLSEVKTRLNSHNIQIALREIAQNDCSIDITESNESFNSQRMSEANKAERKRHYPEGHGRNLKEFEIAPGISLLKSYHTCLTLARSLKEADKCWFDYQLFQRFT